MKNQPNICILAPTNPTGTHDVFVGYVRAFQLLGYDVSVVKFHAILKEWTEITRWKAVTNGMQSMNKESVIRSASLDSVLQVMSHNPDILIIIDGTSVHRDAMDWFRKLEIPTIMVGTESPYQDRHVTLSQQWVDHAYTNEITTAELTGAEYLPVGYDSDNHHPMFVPSEYRHDVVFVGSGFPERLRNLNGVNWDGIDFALFGHYPIGHDHKLSPYYMDSSLPNAKAAFYYAGAKISLNLNRVSVDYEGKSILDCAQSLSPRAYEIPACGGFMISEYREEIDNVYGDLVPTFRTPERLNELIHYWLPRDKERREISDELIKVSKKHSYTERAKTLIKKIHELL